MNTYTPPIRPDELMHFGVLGMKWGIRRYQPYSYTGGRKGGKEIGEAAKLKGGSNGSSEGTGSAKRKGLSDKQKKAIKTGLKVGAVVAGTALAAYGGYKLAEVIKTNNGAAQQILREGLRSDINGAKVVARNELTKIVDPEKYKKELHESITNRINSDSFKSAANRLANQQRETNWHNREGKVINKVKNIGNPYANAFGGYTKWPDRIKKDETISKKDIANIPKMSVDELKSKGLYFEDNQPVAKKITKTVKENHYDKVIREAFETPMSEIKADKELNDIFEYLKESPSKSTSSATSRLKKTNSILGKMASLGKKAASNTDVEDFTAELLKKASKKLK